jgi:hypothetical protein
MIGRRSARSILLCFAVVVFALQISLSNAQSPAPGGFVESATSTGVRPTMTRAQIEALLPARGAFRFPAPYNTQGARITNATDCAGSDCVLPVGYSYWRNINNHTGSNTLYMFVTLSRTNGGGGPTLFSYDKATQQMTKVGALFSSSSGLSYASGEGWYFSATRPHALYLHDGSALRRYDVVARTLETVFDVSTQPGLFGSNRIVWQVHSSDDDRVHSATLKDGSSYAALGCVAYREDTRQFSYFPRIGDFDECQIDKSGRWLLIKENVDARYGEDNRIIDLNTGTERRLLDENGAAGHSDNGHGYMVAADNWDSRPNAIKLWKFGESPLQGTLVYHNQNWNVSAPNHVSHANGRGALAPEQRYACGSSANRTNAPRANEIMCFPLDASLRVLVVAPVMTDLNASGGGDDYSKYPKGNLDVTGEYFMWTSNMSGSRLDAFLVRVPAHLLGSSAPSDTEPPTVAVTSPAGGSMIAGPTTLSAQASDNTGVAGVQFQIDGANIGAEIRTAPYSMTWTPSSAQQGPRVVAAVARDAAGNASTAAVNVTVDTVPPTVANITASGITPSSATITWSTSEPADSQVDYGPTVSYGGTASAAGQRVSHSISLTSLAPNTTYHYRVRSRDAAGHAAVSGDFTFTTTAGTPSSGPLAHWAFEESGGTTAVDATGAYPGTLVNGPLRTAGRIGQALRFDGANDYVTVAHAAPLNAFPLTVSAWFKTASTTGIVGIVNKYAAGSYNGFNIFLNGGALCAWYLRSTTNYAYDGGGCTLRTTGYNDDRWHHVAYVVDATGARLFVDGTQRGTQPWTGTPGAPTTTQALRLAHYPGANGGASYFPGSIDDVRLYNRALSSGEISSLAAASTPPPSGVVVQWPADSSAVAVFDGIDDEATIAHAPAQNAYPITVSAWFATTTASGVRGLVNKYLGGSYNGYNVFFNNGALCAWFLQSQSTYAYDGTGCTHSTSGLNNGAWHHLAYAVDASGGKLYVDGMLRSTVIWTGTPGATTTTEPLRIGRYPGAFGGAEYFEGSVRDVRVYNRALSAAEVQALAGS